MTNLILSAILILCYGAHLYESKPTGGKAPEEEIDSYAIVPSKQQQNQELPPNLELSLDMVPPSVLKSSSPHIFFMNSDGIAEPAETGEVPQRRRRDVAPPPPKSSQNHIAPSPSSSDETMKTDETIIIGPPSGRPFGYSAVTLGFRPAKAHYARRYHKYPWNYH